MKNLTLSEFTSNTSAILLDVIYSGDIVRVETEKHGAVVIMEEPEYKIMRDTLEAVLKAKSYIDSDGDMVVTVKLPKEK